MELKDINIGFTLTGSFCTFKKVIPKIKELKELGANILPIMSYNSYNLDTKKYSTHKLRHTAATLMYQYGNVDIRALQELLGHESISTTEIYTHVANEQVRNAVDVNPLSDYSTDK